MIVQDGNLRILGVVSNATTRMAEGEVMQLIKTGNPETTEEDYKYVVINKTAVLISAACQIGGILGEVSPEREKALGDFGINLGIGFQLMDDILDYNSEEETLGKSIGKDLSEGKVTLPLIHTLRACPPADKERVMGVITNQNRQEDDLRYVMEVVHRCAGIDYTVKRAEGYIDQARMCLSPFPPSQEKEALLAIAEYTISRKR